MFVVRKNSKKDGAASTLQKGLILIGYFGALRAIHFVAMKYFAY